MFKKETHPEIFARETASARARNAKHPNWGFDAGYNPTDEELADNHATPEEIKAYRARQNNRS